MAEVIELRTITVTGKPQEPQESTFQDYMNVLSPFGVQGKYEDTRVSVEDLKRTGVTFEDPTTKAMFDSADIETKRAMLSARNDADALKIYDRRQIFMDSQQRISQDGLATQLAMGAIPALASPTTLIPFGGVFKAAQTANKARKLKLIAAGAGTATVANLADEALIDAQGMPTNYMGVAAASMVLGGGLGLLGGMLSSPKAAVASDNMLEAGNVVSKEYVNDNYVTIDRGTETLLIPKVDKTLYDKIPGLGEWFKSPITQMYQSDSATVRAIASRISNPTVSLKDADGNYVVLGKTGADVKQEIIGNFNSKINVPISEQYAKYKANGGTGSRADFNKEVFRVYTEESIRLKNESKVFADEKAAPDLAKIDEEYKAQAKAVEMPEVWYKDSKGKLQPYTEEVKLADEQAKAEYDAAVQAKEDLNTTTIPQLKEQAKLDIELYQELLKAEGVKGRDLISRMKDIRAQRNAELKQEIKDARAAIGTKITPISAEELVKAEYPKNAGFGTPTPKYWGEEVSFQDNITKSIFIVGSKQTSKTKALHKEWLKEFGLTPDNITEVRAAMLKDIKATRTVKPISDYLTLLEISPTRTTKLTSFKERAVIFKQKPKKDLEAAKAELKAQRAADLDAVRTKYTDEFYANNEINFRTADEAVAEGARTYAKYFDDMLEKAQNLKIEELMGIAKGRLYAPRNWDFGKIAEMPAEMVKQRLRLAVEADARNEYNSEADLLADVEALYNILIDKNAESVLGQGKGYYTKDLPFAKRVSAQKLYVDESKLGDLVHNNFEDVAGMYNYFMSGRMAVQHAFGDMIGEGGDLSNITKMLQEEAYAKGEVVNAKDLKTITNTIDDLLGVRRISQYGNDTAWTASRNLMTYNSARWMGGAGGNQLIEMATITMMNASRGIINKNFKQSAQNVAKMLYKEQGPSNDLGRVLLNSGYMESALHAHRANRLADTEAGFNPKLFERALDEVADFQMKYNGQRYFTALAEDMSGGAIMQYIQRASKSDEALFSRWGLTMDDVRSLKEVLDKDNKNFLDNMTQAQRDKFQLAINRGVAEWVVQPNSIHLPDWFKGAGPVQKLLFQFMKFPMIAQETLLRRGWTEDKAGMIAGIAGAVTMYTTLKYLREEASIALGFTDEVDRKYDIFNDDEQFYRTLMESVNYTANLGMLTTTWNYGSAFLQRPELGREWANRNAIEAIGGPTVGLIQDVSNTASTIVNEGDFTSERQLKNYKQFVPFMALPGVSEGLKAIAETHGD